MDLHRQFSACLEGTPLELATGSQVTITFAMKRNGSVFGIPRISYSHFEGSAEARRHFLEEAHRAVNRCLPLKVTPALGGAIAGQIVLHHSRRAEAPGGTLVSGSPTFGR
jgi:hypothetical protein